MHTSCAGVAGDSIGESDRTGTRHFEYSECEVLHGEISAVSKAVVF